MQPLLLSDSLTLLSPPKRNLIPIHSHSPSLPSPSPWRPLVCFCLLPIPDISYKWDHKPCNLWCLASLRQVPPRHSHVVAHVLTSFLFTAHRSPTEFPAVSSWLIACPLCLLTRATDPHSSCDLARRGRLWKLEASFGLGYFIKSISSMMSCSSQCIRAGATQLGGSTVSEVKKLAVALRVNLILLFQSSPSAVYPVV